MSLVRVLAGHVRVALDATNAPEIAREIARVAVTTIEQRHAWTAVIAIAIVLRVLLVERTPKIVVALTEEEASCEGDALTFDPSGAWPTKTVPCYDPGTMRRLGPDVEAMSAEEVRARIRRASEAQKEWAKSSFATRRKLLRVIQRFILEEQDSICRVSARGTAGSRSWTRRSGRFW